MGMLRRTVLAAVFLIAVASAETVQVVTSESMNEMAYAGAGVLVNVPQVSTHVMLSDGAHVSLWCQNWARRCWRLDPGTYRADVNLDKQVVWIYAERKGKTRKIKYRVSGNW